MDAHDEHTFGDGSAAPPLLSRELVELQRACSHIAEYVRDRAPGEVRLTMEADISPRLARFIVHYQYRDRSGARVATVELDLHPGLPLDDTKWLIGKAELLLALMRAEASDLIIPMCMDHLTVLDAGGRLLFATGTRQPWAHSRAATVS